MPGSASDPSHTVVVQRQEVSVQDRTALVRVASGFHVGSVNRLMMAAGICSLLLTNASCRDDTNILTASTPAQVLVFQIGYSAGSTLWRIVSKSPRKLSVIHYGEVPQGFFQDSPVGVAPRPLKIGERVRTITEEPDRTFRHDCQATSDKGIRCGVWESAPRRTARPTP
jgi:hypothetical protein